MPKEKWEDVDGSVHQIGGDWWSKKWRSAPYIVPQPGGPKPLTKPILVNGEAHTIPEGMFRITCGQCDACMTFYFDLCLKATWI